MGNALDLVNQFYKLFAVRDFDAADELFSDDCDFVTPAGRLNKVEHRGMADGFSVAMPDAHMLIDHVVDGGDEVFIEGRFAGTHSGDMQSPNGPIPASGNKVEARFADYFKVSNGKVIEQRTYWDQMDMMMQLGAMPAN